MLVASCSRKHWVSLESWQDLGPQKPSESIPGRRNSGEQKGEGRKIQLLGQPGSEGWASPGHTAAWTQGSISWWSPGARPRWAGKLMHGVSVTVQSLSPGCGWEPPGTRAGRSQAGRSHAGAALGKAAGRAPGRRQPSSPSAACSLLLALQTWVVFWLPPSLKVSEWLGGAQLPRHGPVGDAAGTLAFKTPSGPVGPLLWRRIWGLGATGSSRVRGIFLCPHMGHCLFPQR